MAAMSDKVVDSVDTIESDLNFGSEEYASSDIQCGSEELIDDKNDEDDEEDEDDEDDEEDVSKYLFADFATTFFIRTDHLYTLLPIKAPLLNLRNESDRIAAQTVWITVQRFMGDLPEPRVCTPPKDSQKSIMEIIHFDLARGSGATKPIGAHCTYEQNKDNQTAVKRNTYMFSRFVSLITRRNKDKPKYLLEPADLSACSQTPPFEEMLTTKIEKLHIIIGNAILRPNLRDEIYCQIMKQLIHNHSRESYARGWVLLALCIGCFVPSDRLINYLENFIDGCPPQYTLYCKERLNRTVVNGTREQPPSWFEMQEATANTKIELHITFMTGNVEAINADSATTARELCQILSERMGLKDQFGFSIYIELFDKVICLGSGDYHIMDAVSQCEHFAKEQAEVIERNAPLRLFFRKEIFAPWHDPSKDAVATDLIYQQVVGGIKIGEYKCVKDDHLAMIAAQKYFIEYGLELSTDRFETVLSSLLPDNVLDKATARNEWKELIKTKLRRSYFVDGTKSRINIKEDVASYAKHKLPLLFSSVCEVHKCSDPSFSTNYISIAVNWTGIYIRDDLEETVLLKLSFPEILAVSSSQQTLTLSVVNGDVYIFWVSRGKEIEAIVMAFLDGLKRRSKYTIAKQDCVHHDATSLKFKRGDLIVLEQSYKKVCASGWSVGKCDCTQESGNVPIKLLHVLPTLTKPPSELLQRVCSGLNASLR